MGRTAGEEKEESKETIGFVVEDSKGDRVPFGTRLCWQSLVCYTFMKQTEYGNGEFPSDERSISVFLRDKAGERAPCLRREASPLGHECTFDG